MVQYAGMMLVLNKQFAVNGTLTAESVPPIDIHHVRKLFMETFVWTSVPCHVELNVSAMQTSDMTAERRVAQHNLSNNDCSKKTFSVSLMSPALQRFAL